MARAVSARLTASAGRQFAFTVGAAMLVLAGVVWWRGSRTMAEALGAVGGALIVAGIVAPARLGPIYRAWFALAAAISKITTPIIMGVLLYGVITPVGLLMRAFGWNPLVRVRTNESAWIRRPEGSRRSDLERQF
jgi:hypothetical protein